MPRRARRSPLVEEWFAKAREDLQAAAILAGREKLAGIAAFHLQQAAEKGLKGYLIHHGWTLVRTHDVEALLNEAATHDRRLSRFLKGAITLSGVYISERYPSPAIGARLSQARVPRLLAMTVDLVGRLSTACGLHLRLPAKRKE